jgi:hypothetical protein
VTFEPAKKRRTRILIAGAVAILAGALLLSGFLIARRIERPDGKIQYSKWCMLCVRCGAQELRKSRTVFGMDYNPWPAFTAPCLSLPDSSPCEHETQVVGIRRRNFDLAGFKFEMFTMGFPDGNFFSTFPALREALSGIAATNLAQSAQFLSAILNLQEGANAPLIQVFPALSFGDAEVLKTVLQIRFSSSASNEIPASASSGVRESRIEAKASLAFPAQ